MVNEFSLEMVTKEPNPVSSLIQNYTELLRKTKKTIVLFGAGVMGTAYLEFFKKITTNQLLFCDNDPQKWKKNIEGIPIINLEELTTTYNDSHIIISSLTYYTEILLQLKKVNLHNNLIGNRLDCNIVNCLDYRDYFNIVYENMAKFKEAYSILSDDYSKELFYQRINYCITVNSKYLIHLKSNSPQYFDPNILSLSSEEIFVDGGSYTGDTVEEFLKQTKGIFKEIYSFEPEKTKHKEFMQKFSSLQNVHLLPYGLWSKKDTLRFNAKNDVSSEISRSGNIEIPVISIDEYLNGKPATFIKMDIEGAEIEALKGAEKTIKEHKPKLAICIYHKPLDLVEIPIFLKELVPEYKIYLRHYSSYHYETVCYAIID